jgi:uncharacterized protein (UPF0212 family)
MSEEDMMTYSIGKLAKKLGFMSYLFEVEVRVYYARCPICGQPRFGLTDDEAKKRLIDHMNENHRWL